jgi:hypothetical protein
MKITIRMIAISLLCLMLTTAASRAAEPTLARLGFWVPAERMTEFEAAYEKQVLPILKRHDLQEWSGRTRATVDSVFARMFAFKTAIEFSERYRALRSDPAFQKVARHLGDTFGTFESGGLIVMDFVRDQSGSAQRAV